MSFCLIVPLWKQMQSLAHEQGVQQSKERLLLWHIELMRPCLKTLLMFILCKKETEKLKDFLKKKDRRMNSSFKASFKYMKGMTLHLFNFSKHRLDYTFTWSQPTHRRWKMISKSRGWDKSIWKSIIWKQNLNKLWGRNKVSNSEWQYVDSVTI